MKQRASLLGCFATSLLLTGCPLTDDYTLTSGKFGNAGTEDNGGSSGEAAQGGGGSSSGEGGALAGSAGLVAGADNAGGGGMTQVIGGDGAGGNAGSGGAEVCGGADLQTDAMNCGVCGKACNVGRSCGDGKCQSGWVPMRVPTIAPRERAAIVAMGPEVFIWGGVDDNGTALADGAIYTPATDTWRILPKGGGAPSARITPTAVWTGKVIVVFGGTDLNVQNVYRDGAVYDPATNSWSAMPAPMSVSRRNAPIGIWDGTRAVFWGGTTYNSAPVSGADRFDLTSWSAANNGGDPGAIIYPAYAFDGTTFYLQGGSVQGVRQDKVSAYNTATDKWSTLPKSLSARSSAFGAWDGSRFVVWGGRDGDTTLRNDGKYLFNSAWTNMATANAPQARMIAYRRSGWAFQVSPGVVAYMGGQISLNQAGTLTTNGATYDVAASTWTTIPPWSTTDIHENGMGAWTGEEFIVWGGRDADGATNTGHRWAP